MSFFSRKKPDIKREIKGEKTAFNIGYYKAQAPEEYKRKLLAKLIGSSVCLAVINSEFMYKEQKSAYINRQQELMSRLAVTGVACKSITVMRKEDMVFFGLKVKGNEERSYEDQVIGLIVDSHNIDAVMPILSSFNLHYYIDCGSCSADELLDRFKVIAGRREELEEGFKYTVFDDNFMKSMVINCKKEDAERTAAILE